MYVRCKNWLKAGEMKIYQIGTSSIVSSGIIKTVCEGKNIRRDGKRRFANLCIFFVFTNKITA
jgi:hypothetical protein